MEEVLGLLVMKDPTVHAVAKFGHDDGEEGLLPSDQGNLLVVIKQFPVLVECLIGNADSSPDLHMILGVVGDQSPQMSVLSHDMDERSSMLSNGSQNRLRTWTEEEVLELLCPRARRRNEEFRFAHIGVGRETQSLAGIQGNAGYHSQLSMKGIR